MAVYGASEGSRLVAEPKYFLPAAIAAVLRPFAETRETSERRPERLNVRSIVEQEAVLDRDKL